MEERSNLISYFGRKRNRILLIVFIIVAALALLYIVGSPKIYERTLPEFKKGYITVKEENEEIARTEDRTAVLGRNILMYAVIEGKELLSQETTFFTEAGKIEIENNEIPSERVEKWDDLWSELKIGWIKIESLRPRFKTRGISDLTLLKYKHRWRFDALSYWTLPADAKPSVIIEWEVQQVRQEKRARFSDPRTYPGTMYFQFRSMIYDGEDILNPIREVKTEGEDTAGPMGLNPAVRRITFIEDETFPGYCTGFINVPYIEDGYDVVKNTKATERYMAITDKSFVYEAARQAGYELEDNSLRGLRKICNLVKKDLFLRASNYVYAPAPQNDVVKYGAGGVQRGDILVIGPKKRLAVVLSDGGMEAKPDGNFDGTDVILTTGNNGLEKQYLAYAIEERFDVWRLKDSAKKRKD